MNNLKDKVVFITGGNKGIGKATALMLLEQEARVFEMSRTSLLSDELPHPALASFRGDVAEEAAMAAAFAACLERFGTVDVLVNNAGIGLPNPDLSQAVTGDYNQMMDTNVRGVFLAMREALQVMKPRKSGHIVNVISMAGQRTNPNSPLYCASKFAARGLSGALADQVLKLGIKVTDVNPGPVDSGYWGSRPVAREKFLQTDDVARVILFALGQPGYMLIREINFDSMKFLAG